MTELTMVLFTSEGAPLLKATDSVIDSPQTVPDSLRSVQFEELFLHILNASILVMQLKSHFFSFEGGMVVQWQITARRFWVRSKWKPRVQSVQL